MKRNHSIASIGAGALVFHEEAVLLVQLNYGRAKGAWILPGGMVEPGEHPRQTAVRETQEETNLNIQISGLVGVRHRIEKDLRANIYYIFLGEILSHNPHNILKWPQEEIMCAQFWSVDEALNSGQVRPLTKEYIRHYLGNSKGALTGKPIPSDHHHNDELFCC